MKLNDKYSIEKEGAGFTLIEKTVVSTRKDGKSTGETAEGQKKRFYGTVYQALQGFIIVSVDDCDSIDIKSEILLILKLIADAKEWIKDEFCIEVRKE